VTSSVPDGPTARRTDGLAPVPIRTRLTDLTGVRYPIIQTGMGFVSGARLTAATALAGGLGIIGSATMTLDELRVAISEVKRRTDAPFGVNVRADAPDAAERVELIIAENIAVASFALAPKQEMIARLKNAGVTVIPSVGAKRHAEKVARWGADAVVVQGGEGGGHTGLIPTSLLIPQVVSAVDIPVVAAGGFFDGRGLVAALAYGAEGIAMGTRFLLTSDSPVADAVKRVYLAKTLTDTVVTTRVDGVPHRVLRTELVDRLERSGRLAGFARAAGNAARFRNLSGLTWPELIRQGRAMRNSSQLSWSQVLMAANTPMLLKAAMVDGRPDLGVLASGQVVGLIEDVPSCAELIDRIMTEACDCLARLGRLSQGPATVTERRWPQRK
jgi:NAD(P)H-dependent flavin oxidoreductase YrpB (nitropropane dioxygenase family)